MRRMFIPLALLAVFIAGCGGSSNRAQSYSGLISKANAICANTTTATHAASQAKDYDKGLKVTEDAVAKLKDLKAPDKLKASYQTFLDKLDASVPLIKQAVAAIDAKDSAKAQSLSAPADAANKQVDQAASAVGLADCAKDN